MFSYIIMLNKMTFSCASAHFCLDTVHVGCEGEVLFLKPKNRGRKCKRLCDPATACCRIILP